MNHSFKNGLFKILKKLFLDVKTGTYLNSFGQLPCLKLKAQNSILLSQIRSIFMVEEIDSEELKSKFDRGEKFRLIDVRESDEHLAGHIPNAESIPLSNFKENFGRFLKDPNEKLVLTCRSGGRSMAAAKFLESRGFKDLTNHEGGASEWHLMEFPLTGEGKVIPSSLRHMPDLT
jgi:rhodanese-related sulfurtransferase